MTIPTAAVGTTLCLIILAADCSRRWGRPRIYLAERPAVTLSVGLITAVLVVAVNIIT